MKIDEPGEGKDGEREAEPEDEAEDVRVVVDHREQPEQDERQNETPDLETEWS